MSVIWLYTRKSDRHLALYKKKCTSFGSIWETLSVIWLYIRKCVLHLALYKEKCPSCRANTRKCVLHLALYKKKCPSFGSIEEKVSVIWLYIRKCVLHWAIYKEKCPSCRANTRKCVLHLALYKKKCSSFGSIEEKVSIIWPYIIKCFLHLAL